LIFIFFATLMCAEARIRCPFRLFRSARKCRPFIVSENGDRAPLVRAFARVKTMRSGARIAVRGPVLDTLVHLRIEKHRREELNPTFVLRQIDMLTPAGLPAVIQRGQHCD
jgi:hypothetical protein